MTIKDLNNPCLVKTSSNVSDKPTRSEKDLENFRDFLMGWKTNSNSMATYMQRDLKIKNQN